MHLFLGEDATTAKRLLPPYQPMGDIESHQLLINTNKAWKAFPPQEKYKHDTKAYERVPFDMYETNDEIQGLRVDKKCSTSRATADPWSKILFHSRSKEGEGKSLDVSRKSSVIHSRRGSVAPP